MKRQLVYSKAFEKSYQKFAAKNQLLNDSVARALLKLEHDAFDPALKTHKLTGKLAAFFACSDMTVEFFF